MAEANFESLNFEISVTAYNAIAQVRNLSTAIGTLARNLSKLNPSNASATFTSVSSAAKKAAKDVEGLVEASEQLKKAQKVDKGGSSAALSEFFFPKKTVEVKDMAKAAEDVSASMQRVRNAMSSVGSAAPATPQFKGEMRKLEDVAKDAGTNAGEKFTKAFVAASNSVKGIGHNISPEAMAKNARNAEIFSGVRERFNAQNPDDASFWAMDAIQKDIAAHSAPSGGALVQWLKNSRGSVADEASELGRIAATSMRKSAEQEAISKAYSFELFGRNSKAFMNADYAQAVEDMFANHAPRGDALVSWLRDGKSQVASEASDVGRIAAESIRQSLTREMVGKAYSFELFGKNSTSFMNADYAAAVEEMFGKHAPRGADLAAWLRAGRPQVEAAGEELGRVAGEAIKKSMGGTFREGAGLSAGSPALMFSGIRNSIGNAIQQTSTYSQVKKVTDGITSALSPALRAAGADVAAFSSAMSAAATPITAVVIAIQAVVKIIQFLIKQFQEVIQICKKVKAAFEQFNQKFNPFVKLKAELASILALAKRQVLRRAINAVIKAVTEGLKAGVSNLAEYDAEFKSVIQSYKNSMGLFKNSIGVAVAPIISYFIPAINKLLAALTAAMNTFARLTALLTGKHTYTIAKSYEDIGDSASGANGKVKELQRTILGFDEINKLNGQNGSGAGGGSGSSDGISAYETMDVGDWPYDSWGEALLAFVQWLDTEGVPKLDGAFQNIAKHVNTFSTNLADALSFEGVQDAISDLASDIGDSLNNFLNGGAENGGIDWEEMGRAFGQSILTIFNFAANFLKQINLIELGGNIATALNTALSQLTSKDVENIAYTIFTFLTAGIQTAIGFLLTVDFPKLAEVATGIINSLVLNIQKLVGGGTGEKHGGKWQSNFEIIANNIASGIVGFLNGIDWEQFFATANQLVDGIFNGLNSILDQVLANKQFVMAIRGFIDLIFKIGWEWFKLKLRLAIGTIGSYIGEVLYPEEIFGGVVNGAPSYAMNGWDVMFGTVETATNTAVGSFEELGDAADDTRRRMSGAFTGSGGIVPSMKGMGDAARTASSEVYTAVNGANGIIPMMEKLPTASAKPISDYCSKVDGLRKDVVDDFSATRRDSATHLETLRSASNQKFDNMQTWATKHAETLRTNVTSKLSSAATDAGKSANSIKTSVVDAVDGAKSAVAQQNWNGVGGQIKAGIKSGMEFVGGDLKQWADNIKAQIKREFNINSPSRWARDVIGVGINEGIVVGMENSTSMVDEACSGIKEGISSQFDDMTFFGNITASTRGGGDIATAIGNQVTSGIASMTTNENERPIVCEVYLDRDRIATAVTRGQQNQNRRYSTTALS